MEKLKLMRKVVCLMLVALVICVITPLIASASTTSFEQGLGYQAGAYDINAIQPAAFNWTRNSRFIGPNLPVEKWLFSTFPNGTSPAVASDGTIYIGSGDAKLYAINSDGSKKWEFGTGWTCMDPIIGSDGVIYIGASSSGFYAINPDGSQKWVLNNPNYFNRSAALGNDGTIYVGGQTINGFGSKLFAINPNGTIKWTVGLNGSPSSTVIASDGTIYVSSGDGDYSLYAISPQGTIKWKVQSEGGIYDCPPSSPSIADDGTIFFCPSNKNLYAINPDGSKKWEYVTGGFLTATPAIGSDGSIYLGSLDGKMYAINPDGTKKWDFSTSSQINSTAIIDANGTIYFGSEDGKLYAINPGGIKKWDFQCISSVDAPITISSDGTLYVLSHGSGLYAIGNVELHNDSTLKEIILDGNRLSNFSSTTESYNVELPYGTTVVPAVTAIANDPNANVVITSATTLPGSTIIKVTAEDRVTTKTYTVNFTLAVLQPLTTPTANTPSGEVLVGTKVNLTTNTDGAIIYYTLDGSGPVVGGQNTHQYDSNLPIVINTPVTIKAIAVKAGMPDSEVMTETYTLQVSQAILGNVSDMWGHTYQVRLQYRPFAYSSSTDYEYIVTCDGFNRILKGTEDFNSFFPVILSARNTYSSDKTASKSYADAAYKVITGSLPQ